MILDKAKWPWIKPQGFLYDLVTGMPTGIDFIFKKQMKDSVYI